MREGFTAFESTHAGESLRGWVIAPEGQGLFPGVLVMHNALGLKDQVFDSARKLAALGYLALVTDMYGVGADLSSPGAAGSYYQAFHDDPGKLRARVVHWRDALAGRADTDASRIAAIGYCFGGTCVLELARSDADVKAVVSFHGILSTAAPAAKGAIPGLVAAYCGANDPFAPMDQIERFREEMAAAEARLHLTVFGDAAHGFTDVSSAGLGMAGIEYQPVAHAVSWAGMVALLEKTLLV